MKIKNSSMSGDKPPEDAPGGTGIGALIVMALVAIFALGAFSWLLV